MKGRPDEQDLWCSGWAATRRAIHGIGRHKITCPHALNDPSKLEQDIRLADALLAKVLSDPKGPDRDSEVERLTARIQSLKHLRSIPCNCIEPTERMGKLKCTLGRIREDREGAASAGVVSQNFPEVYGGMSLLIHRAWYEMPERLWMLVMDGHYVWREIPVKVKAPLIGIKDHDWFQYLTSIKGYLRGYVQLARRDGDDFVPVWKPSKTFVRLFEEKRETELIVVD